MIKRAPKGHRSVCTVEFCGKFVIGRGLCAMHYRKRWQAENGPCSSPGCKNLSQVKGMKLCTTHYRAQRDLGKCGMANCDGKIIVVGRAICETHYYRDRHGKPMSPKINRHRVARGSGHVNKLGYREMSRDGTRDFEHRILMAESLGRKLLPGETVHHKNGIRHDNRLARGHEIICHGKCCNLELWSSAQPSGQRVIDKLAWADALIAQYRK